MAEQTAITLKDTVMVDFLDDDDLTERATEAFNVAIDQLGRSVQSVLMNDFYNFHTGITEAQAAFRRGNLYLRELKDRKENA